MPGVCPLPRQPGELSRPYCLLLSHHTPFRLCYHSYDNTATSHSCRKEHWIHSKDLMVRMVKAQPHISISIFPLTLLFCLSNKSTFINRWAQFIINKNRSTLKAHEIMGFWGHPDILEEIKLLELVWLLPYFVISLNLTGPRREVTAYGLTQPQQHSPWLWARQLGLVRVFC
jgi:hypothetical protein